MQGIILVDKPKGISSFFVVKRIKSILKIKKVGHAGTLDPNATGLLVILIGKYTKLADFLTAEDKVYQTVITLGITTSTDDIEGEVLEKKDFNHIDKVELLSVLESFLGRIKQIPPKFSAVKINGERAYKLARKSLEFQMAPKEIEIFDLKLLDFALPNFCLKVWCSKGTYVRSLARDIGTLLGVGGMALEIHREKSGFFHVKQAIKFQDFSEKYLKENIFELSFIHDKTTNKRQNS